MLSLPKKFELCWNFVSLGFANFLLVALFEFLLLLPKLPLFFLIVLRFLVQLLFKLAVIVVEGLQHLSILRCKLRLRFDELRLRVSIIIFEFGFFQGHLIESSDHLFLLLQYLSQPFIWCLCGLWRWGFLFDFSLYASMLYWSLGDLQPISFNLLSKVVEGSACLTLHRLC